MADPHIRILMATCQGATYLQAQLDSFLDQTHDNWSLWVSDDGSRDGTQEILARFQKAHPRREIRLFTGPQKGVSANFLSLLRHRDWPAGGGVAALSDQDDVWLPDRLAACVAHLRTVPAERPCLYAAATLLTDAALRPQRPSRPPGATPGFSNALVQNVLAGNTLALTPGALRLIRQAPVRHAVPFHDWWLYLLITGAGGKVLYDPVPRVLYRQHPGNVLGAAHGLPAAGRRMRLVLNGSYRRWIAANLDALHTAEALLTPENRAKLALFSRARSRIGRLRDLRAAGVRRQGPGGQATVSALALAGRI